MNIKFSNWAQEPNRDYHVFGIEVKDLAEDDDKLYELGEDFERFLTTNMYPCETAVNIVDGYGDGYIDFEIPADGTKAEAKKDFMRALKTFKRSR